MARVAALVTLAALALGPLAGVAQTLPSLHITALGMHGDKRSVAVGEPFHVTIHVHVTETRDRLDELVLPTLDNAIDLGDERRRVATPGGGTDFYEIMTVAASAPGRSTFSPAYIDAIDPANGRAFRYSSQPLTVRVSAGAPLDTLAQSVLRGVLQLALWVGGALVALIGVLVLVWALRLRARRKPRPTPPAPEPVSPPAAAATAGDPLRRALAEYRLRPDDATLDALRAALFGRAGAAPGATLADALQALGRRDPDLARAMAVAERARFGPAGERDTAQRDLLALLDAYLQAEPVA